MPAAEKKLLEHQWSGNVRELENVIGSAVVLCPQPEIGPEDCELVTGKSCSKRLKDVERRHIRKVLRQLKGNKTHAAEVLGIALSTLHAKIKDYKLG